MDMSLNVYYVVTTMCTLILFLLFVFDVHVYTFKFKKGVCTGTVYYIYGNHMVTF